MKKMTFKDLVKTSFGNLGRHKVRTILSAIGVTVGILTIVTMLSLGVGIRQEIVNVFEGAGLENVRVRPATEEQNALGMFIEPQRTVLITPKLVEELRARNDVLMVKPRVFVPWGVDILLQLDGQTLPISIRESTTGLTDPFTKPPEILAGRELSDEAQGEIVISAGALEALGYERAEYEGLIGREVSLALEAPRGDAKTFSFHVVGILETYQEDRMGYYGNNVGLADTLAIKAWWYNDPDLLENEGYDDMIIQAASLNDAVQIVEQLQTRGFQVESLRTMLSTVNKAMVILQTMLGSIGGLALLVASIGITNTMVMTVYERTREIGILKAIGASPRDIRLLFMAEAALIGLLGGVVGTVGGWLLGLGLNEAILTYLHWREIPVTGTFFVVTGWLVLLALAFATVVGLLAGLYPAARAARLDPLEALRYE